MGETRELVSYLHNIKYSELDAATIDMAKKCIEDFIGVAIRGSSKPEALIWKEYYKNKKAEHEASTFQPGFERFSVEQAAALNAVYGHVMDMDDVHNASIVHLAVVTVPVAVALAQRLHKSGRDVIEAIAAGYEMGARVGEAINPSSYKYWHTTGVVGALSSGITAAKLLTLSEEETINCVGSSGTQAAGLWEFLDSGAMSKVLHTANANLCGLRAAELAKLGFTGSPTILEGERGLIRALAPQFDLSCLTDGYGEELCICRNSFKPYACCRHTHSANYCIEKIMSERSFLPADIVSIVDETYSTAAQITDDPHPKNAYRAKFSLQFCIAAMLIFKELGDGIFTSANLTNPSVLDLMGKIVVRVDPQLDEEFRKNTAQWPHRIILVLKDGRVISERVDFPLGDPQNPFSWEIADRKFRQLTADLLNSRTLETLLNRFHDFEQIEDVNTLFQNGEAII